MAKLTIIVAKRIKAFSFLFIIKKGYEKKISINLK